MTVTQLIDVLRFIDGDAEVFITGEYGLTNPVNTFAALDGKLILSHTYDHTSKKETSNAGTEHLYDAERYVCANPSE